MTTSAPMVAADVPRPARTLVLGCGSIGQAIVPLLIRDLQFDPRSIRVVEMADTRHRIAESIAAGVTYEQAAVTRENLASFLAERLSSGDLLLDLAWNIDANTIISWCRAAMDCIQVPASETSWPNQKRR